MNNKPGTPYTQTQYVIANKRQRDNIATQQYMTNKDYDMLSNRLKRYVQSITTDYTSYSRRGKSNRWVCVNSWTAGTLVNGAIVMDISKLLALGGYGNKKYASIMHKTAHRIKVNALKPALVTGDKYITYGN